MKKLNLLKPELRVTFLNEGKGEKVNYLYISDQLTNEALNQDVEAGAVQFEELKNQVEKANGELSRIVVLRSNNRENLYMAASYLAGICNEKNQLDGSSEELDDLFDEVDELFEEYEEDKNEDELMSDWYESPFRLPIIDIRDLRFTGENNGFSPFGNDFMSLGIQQPPRREPFWMSCLKEPVAILIQQSGFFCESFEGCLERFQSNRNVFLLILEEDNSTRLFFGMEDDEDSLSCWEQQILQLLLETTADIAWVKTEEKELEDYRQLQFENWVNDMGMQLAPKFPKRDISNRIMALKDKKKSELIEKVLKYIKKERRKDDMLPLTAEDFDVLRKFKALSDNDEKEKSENFQQQMEKELVGMESVKTQIRNLVQTMKFGKYREKMGLGKSDFHNVHLLIGAPGTAKTSIAKLLGNMMCEAGILPDNRFISVNGADLKGKYVGHSGPKTRALFEQYDIILIDEAYSLAASDGRGIDSFSQEALAQLMIELEAHAMDKLVLFAGYGGTGIEEKDNKMKEFLDANPGLKSRINTTIFFDSYTPQEMVQIVRCQAKLQKYSIAAEADTLIQEYFEERVKAADFGNGREARSLLENAIISAAARIMALPEKRRTKKMMQQLTMEDIQNAVGRLRESNLLQRGRERKVCGF